MLVLTFFLVSFLGLFANAYVPASPTNSTQDAIAGGLNVTDISNLHLQWYSNGFVLPSPLHLRVFTQHVFIVRTRSMSHTN